MASERSKRRDFLSLSFIAKSISTKLLIKLKAVIYFASQCNILNFIYVKLVKESR